MNDCVCGLRCDDGSAHPTPCFMCRAKADECECCGAPGVSFYPYGIYCVACGDDVTHPTGYGWCFVENDREHRSRKPTKVGDEKERP